MRSGNFRLHESVTDVLDSGSTKVVRHRRPAIAASVRFCWYYLPPLTRSQYSITTITIHVPILH